GLLSQREKRWPVDQHSQGRGIGSTYAGRQQEFRSPRSDRVTHPVVRKTETRLKERFWRTAFERRSARVCLDFHEPAVGGEIEQFSALGTPPGLGTSARRNLPFCPCGRESGYEDLLPDPVFEDVCDPAAVWRELAL